LRKKEDEMRIRRRKKPCPKRGNRKKISMKGGSHEV